MSSFLPTLQNKMERNRYIIEMARCMLHEKELPKQFWVEAANTTVFLENQLPTKASEDKTPFEA